jgi:hypothetical protein
MGMKRAWLIAWICLPAMLQGQALSQRPWVIALPFETGLSDAASGHSYEASHSISMGFYQGFRAAVESLNASNDSEQIQLHIVEYRRNENRYWIHPSGMDHDSIIATDNWHLTPAQFAQWVNEQGAQWVIGPLHSQSVSELANQAKGFRVLSPLSKHVVEASDSSEVVLTASASDLDAMEHLGAIVAIDQVEMAYGDFLQKDSLASGDSITQVVQSNKKIVVFQSADNPHFRQKADARFQAFMQGYDTWAGDSSFITLVSLSDTLWKHHALWEDSSQVSLLLDVSATELFSILKVIKNRNPLATQLLLHQNAVNRTVSMPSVLLRFPFTWVQTTALPDASHSQAIDAMWSLTGHEPGRWEWLGYDSAFLLNALHDESPPHAVQGPRRLFIPERVVQGYRNHGTYRYSFHPDHGFTNDHGQPIQSIQ